MEETPRRDRLGAAPRKILYAAWAPFFSGAERALLLTVQSLDPRRYSPSVLVGTDGELAAQLRTAGVECRVLALAPRDSRHPVRWARTVVGFVQACARVKPALVHANDLPTCQSIGSPARLLRLPTITHVRFPDAREGYRWFLAAGFTRAIFVSRSARADGDREAPDVFCGRSTAIYDPVRVPRLLSDDERTALRSSLGLGPADLAIGLTGQIAVIKGVWEFVEAAAAVAGRLPSARFFVVGEDLQTAGAVRRELTERVRGMGLESHFTFTGYRQDAVALAAAFDITVVPSHVEPLGLSALEAMAAGRPVVASAVGGLTETVVHGETGLLVPPRDTLALGDALERLANSPEERVRFGSAGRARVQHEFSQARHADRLQALYDAVLRNDPTG